MAEASKLLVKLSRRLFQSEREQSQFVDWLIHPKPIPACILWCQKQPASPIFQVAPPLDWQPPFVDRLLPGAKPGQHPLHDQGAFYCLDCSSVFAVSPVKTLSSVSTVVDVCASPGGKSILTWVALRPKWLLSNEVIGKRTAALISNLRRCQVQPVTITQMDSEVLAREIPQTADLVVVDAPCSGQSLLAKGGKAPGCFHPVSINSNANRQKRIVANSARIVGPQGYLLYMTCTYSPEENEQVMEWFLTRFPHFQPIALDHLQPYRSHLSDIPCYRLFPQSGLGAGAFTALLQNTEMGNPQPLPEAFKPTSSVGGPVALRETSADRKI